MPASGRTGCIQQVQQKGGQIIQALTIFCELKLKVIGGLEQGGVQVSHDRDSHLIKKPSLS